MSNKSAGKVNIEEEKLRKVLYNSLDMLFEKLEKQNKEIDNLKSESKRGLYQAEKKRK